LLPFPPHSLSARIAYSIRDDNHAAGPCCTFTFPSASVPHSPLAYR
jgi:hypothetical protein